MTDECRPEIGRRGFLGRRHAATLSVCVAWTLATATAATLNTGTGGASAGQVVAYVRSLSSSQTATTTAEGPQNTQRTLEVADYVELPVTGEKSTNLISGQLARGSILR